MLIGPWKRLSVTSARAAKIKPIAAWDFGAGGRYRDLGIDRSLDGAYRLWHEQNPESEPDAESVKGRRASGQWHRESRENAWVERARAYDAELFQTEARDVALASISYMRGIRFQSLLLISPRHQG
jgi:hypothetical protein